MTAVIKEDTGTFWKGLMHSCDEVILLNYISYEISTGTTSTLTLWGDVSVGIVFPVVSWTGGFCRAVSRWQRPRQLLPFPQAVLEELPLFIRNSPTS